MGQVKVAVKMYRQIEVALKFTTLFHQLLDEANT